MAVTITSKDIEKLSKLANLSVSKREEEKLSKLLSETLKYVRILNELDTSNVKETYQVSGLTNVFQRENHVKTSLTQKEALSNVKTSINGKFEIKGVFDR